MTDDGKGPSNSPPQEGKKEPEFVKTYGAKSYDDFGYYFYPDRVPGKVASRSSDLTGFSGMVDAFKKGGIGGLWSFDPMNKFKCRLNVHQCARKDERVKMLLRALNAHGCPFDLDRHVSCETCKLKISGGFDNLVNQVVVCENNVKNEWTTCNVVAHEMLHAFDKCRAKYDPTNLEHAMCTEIRAANMFHCHLLNAYINGEARPWDLSERHKNCVKRKAITSVMLCRNLTPEKADEVFDRVFNRCYNDMEPFGRRLRHWTWDIQQSLNEGLLYGFFDDRTANNRRQKPKATPEPQGSQT